MSHFPAPSSTSTTPAKAASSPNFEIIFKRALKAYEKKTKQDLTTHPFAAQFQACESPAAIRALLQDQVDEFKRSRSGDERLQKWLSPTINVLYALSATLGEGVGLAFPPAKAIFAGARVLLLAAKGVEASEEVLIDVFERVENFFRRLEIYIDVPPTTAMTEMMAKIMAEVLDIIGTATEEMKQSRAKKFLKKVAGIRRLEDGLKKLDKMTNEEARMASAEMLRFAHNIDKKVERVDEKVRGVDEKARGIDEGVKVVGEKVLAAIDDGREAAKETKLILQTTAYNIDDVKRRQLRGSLRKWQSPSDPSKNHIIASEYQHEGTAEWLCKGDIFGEWKVTGSLMWIHGKPGSGKSILCSAIINDIETLHKAGLASMAYFYFDFRDVDKRSRRDLLCSLLIQLSARSDPFCDILSRLYKEYDDGTHQPSDSALVDCLKEMLTLPDQVPVYLIMDALDECPNTSDIPSPREKVLELVKELVGLLLPSLRICVTSRREVDIQNALEGLAAYSLSLHNEIGQKKDIEEYIKSVVNYPADTFMKQWRDDDKDLVIKTLSEKADGMFRWVFCQLEILRRCLPQNVPCVLTQLPASLDETYERVLKEIGNTNQSCAYRLLQCLTVAIRPLRVGELAEILALDFDRANEGIPELKERWRSKDQQEAVLSTCSGLVSIVNDGPHRVVQFSHYSVKEFLTSDRLATSRADISHFHILLEPAHTTIAKACLGILLQSENDADDAKTKSSSPLAKYAAEHWVGHAQFKKVSTRVEDGMRRLFDPAKLHFEAWLMLHDIDKIQYNFIGRGRDGHHGSPLYYASLCGFRDLAAHLLTGNPQHVNAPVGQYRSPLVAALYRRHFDIADLLYQHGADAGIRGDRNQTLLHVAAEEGSVEIFQWIFDRGVDANLQQGNHGSPLRFAEADQHPGHSISINAEDITNNTPLHLASRGGQFEVVRQLLLHGADATAQDRRHNTPLHLASSSESVATVRILIEHGADVTAKDQRHRTPLHLASFWYTGKPTNENFKEVKAKIVRVLMKHGADVNACDESHSTPLHMASSSGSAEAVQLLIEHGADVTTQDLSQNTPLHLASRWQGSINSKVKAEAVRVLMKHGADVNARNENHEAPLHMASSSQSAETMQLLIERGADVTAQDLSQNTPLHLISSWDEWRFNNEESDVKADIIQVLMKNGADINARNGSHETPLHLASSSRSAETVRLLINHGADVTVWDHSYNTPLHLASSWDEWMYPNAKPNVKAEIVQLLMKHGADVNARDWSHKTPLHLASSSGGAKTVRLLIEHEADVTAQDRSQNTPLHLASSWNERKSQNELSNVKAEIVQVLMKHGADVKARDGSHRTPLHLASSSGSAETVQLLIEHRADVTARDRSQNTPLHLALSWQYGWGSYSISSKVKAEIVRVLTKHGADVNTLNENHEAPLHIASSSRSAETVRILLEHGTDINARDGSSSTPLHLASSSGNAETVRLLIEHGADVTAQDLSQNTPLHLASSWNERESQNELSNVKAEIVQVLIKHGADVNPRNGSHKTPLHLASSSGSSETVRLLIKNGADVTAQDRGQNTPLHLALSWDMWPIWTSHWKRASAMAEVVRVLIAHGADVSTQDGRHKMPLHLASSSRSAESVRVLIECGADFNARDGGNSTPLHMASFSGSAEAVHMLTEHGADVNERDGSHKIPLHLASSSGSAETVRLLIEHGADVTALDQGHNTPLHLASSRKEWGFLNEHSNLKAEIVQVLIKHGADVNLRDGNHKTPLHLASSSGSAQTVWVLIGYGADVTALDRSQNTPLHLASSCDVFSPGLSDGRILNAKAEIIRVLIKHGAEVNTRDGSHKTPLHLASSSGSAETVQLLIKHGADVTAQDRSQNMPLHLALSRVDVDIFFQVSTNTEIVRVLIDHGADINARDGSGSTPLHIASSNGNAEPLHMLIKHGADVNAQDASQNTPLHLASSLGTAETVRLLSERGLHVVAKYGGSSAPLRRTPSSRSPGTVWLLVSHGADVNARDGSHKTPLHLASSSGIAENVRLLIDHGADVNAQDRSHMTPLHMALSLWSPQNVWRLIKADEDADVEDAKHKLSLLLEPTYDEKLLTRLPQEESDEKGKAVLGSIQHMEGVTSQDDIRSAPLPLDPSKPRGKIAHDGADINSHFPLAALSRLALESDVIRLLLEHGADVDAEDDQCRTPLQIASSLGLSDIAQLLSDHRARGE